MRSRVNSMVFKAKIVHLRLHRGFFRHPLSISLNGGILSTIAKIDLEVLSKMLTMFLNDNPPFLVSSLFPLVPVGDGWVRLYRLPDLFKFRVLRGFVPKNPREYRIMKSFRALTYIPEKIFINIINNRYEIKKDVSGFEEVINEVRSVLGEGARVYRTFSFTHTAISRVSGHALEGRLFQEKLIHTIKNTMWFLILIQEEFEDIVLSALKILGDIGLSGKRSWGRGKYEIIDVIDASKILNKMPTTGNYIYLLSDIILGETPQVTILEESYYSISYRQAIATDLPFLFLKKGYFVIHSGGVIKLQEKMMKIREIKVKDVSPSIFMLGNSLESGKILGRRIIEIGHGIGIFHAG